MYDQIDHIGIAVRSLKNALTVWENSMGFSPARIEEVPEHRTRVAIFPIGESRIELLEAMEDDSPVARFIARRGEGLHHICFRVQDLAHELERLRADGVHLVDETPRRGADGCLVAFIHPSGSGGVLIELSQPASITGHHLHADKL